MRKYVTKILCVLAVLLVFTMSFFLGMERDITKYAAGIIADTKMEDEDPCSSGDGVQYYLKAEYKVRSGPSLFDEKITTYKKCTQVTVYCEKDGWGKISKTADMWINMTGLQLNKPSKCSAKTTATGDETPITYTLSDPEYIPAPDMDQMYSNKVGQIKYTLTDVKNLANDDDDLIQIFVFSGSCTSSGCPDVTDKFIVETNYSDGEGYILLTQNDPEMNGQTYLVTVIIGDQYSQGYNSTKNVKYSEFDIVGKYYDFSIIQEESGVTTDYPGNPSSEKNEFEVKITDLVDATNYDAFDWDIKKFDKDGNELSCYNSKGKKTDCINKFKVEHTSNTLFNFYNYYESENKRPTAGIYRLYIYYQDEDYSTARGVLEDYFEFEIGYRQVKFERQDIYSQRYVRSSYKTDYAIQITRVKDVNGEKQITFKESNKEYTMTETEFLKTYSDFGLADLTYNADGYLIHKFDTDKNLIHYNPWYVGYYADDGTWYNSTPDKMATEYPGVVDEMLAKYTVASDQYLNLVATGQKTIRTKYLSPDNQLVFAAVGGKIKFTYAYENIYDEDFENATITIKRDDGTVVDESEGFTFEWSWNNGELIMYLTYDNEDEELAGDYTIYIEMNEIQTLEVPFSLYDGEVDFYLTSQIDAHLESATPLATQYPPGNQRYEYYVGFYLVKSGAVQNTKNAKMIDVKIYDHLVDLDENGEMYFYDQIDYEVRVQSYLNGLVTYQVALNGGAFTTVTNEDLATFTSKYSQAASMLDMYTYDATTGAITGNKFELNITRYYNDESIGDMQVVFTDATGTETTMPLQEFKVLYPDMYAYLITRFSFDDSDNIIPGAIIGNYKVTEYDGTPIEGNDITSLFDITIDPAADNVEKPITILPKTEVAAGEYFVYVTYDNLQGVGFVNNAEDAVISKELFPEMWEQNTHMTSIVYIDPEYSLDVHEPELSNEGNDSLKIYNNIKGKAKFDIDYNYIYNYDGVTYKIEYNNGTSWIDASDRFTIINTLDPDSTYYDLENPYIELNTIVGSAVSGTYRLTVNYENNGFTATDSQTFDIGGKYYGLLIEEGTQANFVHNYQETKPIMAKAIYVNEAGNIVPSIMRKVSGGSDELLTHNASTKSFTNSSGQTVFTYTYNVYTDYYEKENETLYEFLLTNVANVTDVGDYEITFSYQEGTNDVSNTSLEFTVTDDEYYYNLSNEKPVANETGMYLYMDIDTKYINYEDLDYMSYAIYYYDFDKRAYVDVSSQTSDNKMFDITDSWDNTSGPDYKGTLKITINEALVDMGGNYYIEAYFKDQTKEFPISNLRTLFSWNIEKVTIGSIYTETELIDGVEVSKDIQLDAIYNNLGNANIDIEIKSVYENDVQWVINKSCISTAGEGECSPEGTNYNSRFNEVNTTGTDGKLKLTLKEGLTEKEMLAPGEYSLILYYNSDNFNFINFEVKSEYAEVIINDYLIYTQISEDKVADGLYKNKDGYITLYTTLRGIDYDTDLLTIDITDANGDNSVLSPYFVMDSSSFAEVPHELIFNYDSSTELEPGSYVITLSYDTVDGPIYATLPFEMHAEYFNFFIGEPTYNPDPLYPNLENGGTATFRVETEDIPDVVNHDSNIDARTEKHVMAANTRIFDEEGNDVTEYFQITAVNHENSVLDNSFDLNISFTKNAVDPGEYTIRMNYELYDYVVSKEQTFEIGGYKKDFKITSTEIISDTKDGRIHNNVGGTYRFNISTDFELYGRGLEVSVADASGNDLTDYFTYSLQPAYIDLKYVASEPYIEAGELTVTFIYQESASTDIFTTGTTVQMYGKYVDLTISNLKQSTEELYSDLTGQYITFDIASASIKEEQKSEIIFKVFDAENNLVYSDDATDNVTNQFTITNNWPTGGNIKLDIVPFAARIGKYTIQAYLPDEDGDNNISNELTFEIEYNYYYVRFANKSTIKSVNAYEGDTTKIYEVDGADVFYQFVTNYKSAEYEEFSIKIYDGLTLVKELDTDFLPITEDGVKYVTTEFITGELEPGEYDVAVAINGLPYNWKTITVSDYIPVTKATIKVNNIAAGEQMTVYKGQILNLSYTVEPANATNKTLNFSSSNSDNILVDDETKKAYIYGSETTDIILSNRDIKVSTSIVVDDRLSSDVYQIDYDNLIIYVDKMTGFSLDYDTFFSNLKAVVLDHKFISKTGEDVTGNVSKVGTGLQLVNGAETYTVVVIGDINQDGKIGLGDVANLYNYVSGTTQMNEYQILAGQIRKSGIPRLGDVAKLFNFYVGTITEI